MRFSVFSSFTSSRRDVCRRAVALSLLLGVFASTFAASLAQESREWRNAAGRPIKTSTNEKLVGTLRLDGDDEPGKVRIKMGGKTFRFTLANLSEADQKYVAEQRAPKNASAKPNAAKPTPLSTPLPALAEDASRALVAIPKDGVKRALLVGVDDYADFSDLKYAGSDVSAIRKALIELGFKDDNIVELISSGSAGALPFQRNIEKEIEKIFRSSAPNDLVFLFFSGHGFQINDVAYFAPLDAVATGDERVVEVDSAISLTEIIERLEVLPAKFKWMVIDACRENPTETKSVSSKELKNIAPPPGVLILQSCAEGEYSFEDAKTQGGLFTGALLEALGGKADFDDDGAISALDVCKYAAEKTADRSRTLFAASQTPYFKGDFADFVIAENLKKDGLSREKWQKAEALGAESTAAMKERKYVVAQKKIDEALAIVADAPSENKTKKRLEEQKANVERMLSMTSNAFKLFGKVTETVSTVPELLAAIENAVDGDVVELVAGSYHLNEEVQIKNGAPALTLVGATGNRKDVCLTSSGTHDLFTVGRGAKLSLVDLSLDSRSENALTSYGASDDGKYADSEVTAIRCSFSSGEVAAVDAIGKLILKDCRVANENNLPYTKDFPRALEARTLAAVNCDIIGGVEITPRKLSSVLNNCRIVGGFYGFQTSGHAAESETALCQLIKCQFMNCERCAGVESGGKVSFKECEFNKIGYQTKSNFGIYVEDGVVTVEESSVYNCTTGIQVEEKGQATVDDTSFSPSRADKYNDCVLIAGGFLKISNSSIMGYYNAFKFYGDGGECEATDIDFSNLTRYRWHIGNHNVRAIYDGREVSQETLGAYVYPLVLPHLGANKETAVERNKATITVSNVDELRNAIETAQDGAVVALAKGKYNVKDEAITIRNKKITLVGATGDYRDVYFEAYGQKKPSVFEVSGENSELTLIDARLNSAAANGITASLNATVKATRCFIDGETEGLYGISGTRFILKECYVRNENSQMAASVNSLQAENCNFRGGVNIQGDACRSLLKNCIVHDSRFGGISVSGNINGEDAPYCEIIDCEIRDVDLYGIKADYRGTASVRGGKILRCKYAMSATDDGALTVENIKITDCGVGVSLSQNGTFEGENVVFDVNITDKWDLESDAGTATLNGKAISKSEK